MLRLIEIIPKLVILLLTALFISCAAHPPKLSPAKSQLITEYELYKMHQDTRFVYFQYSSGEIKSGLLLRWQNDSILIQPRHYPTPVKIPSAGISSIISEIGNHGFLGAAAGIASGITVGGLAFLASPSWELHNAGFPAVFAKVILPPALAIGGFAYGSSKPINRHYTVPDGFKFDYNWAEDFYKEVGR